MKTDAKRQKCVASMCQFAAVFALLSVPALARCPVTPNATVIVHAPIGNFIVDTTGVDAVDVEVNNRSVTAREVTCTPNLVEYEGSVPPQFSGEANWRIRAPKT